MSTPDFAERDMPTMNEMSVPAMHQQPRPVSIVPHRHVSTDGHIELFVQHEIKTDDDVDIGVCNKNRARTSRTLFQAGVTALVLSLICIVVAPLLSVFLVIASIATSLYNVTLNLHHQCSKDTRLDRCLVRKYAIRSMVILICYLTLLISVVTLYVTVTSVLLMFGLNLHAAVYYNMGRDGDIWELDGPFF